jgi:hypothetical protein
MNKEKQRVWILAIRGFFTSLGNSPAQRQVAGRSVPVIDYLVPGADAGNS